MPLHLRHIIHTPGATEFYMHEDNRILFGHIGSTLFLFMLTWPIFVVKLAKRFDRLKKELKEITNSK